MSGQVSEEFFRSQLIEELGSTNFDDDAADTGGFAPGQLYFLHTQHKQNNHIMTCILLHMLLNIKQVDFLGCNLHYVPLNQREELAISLLNNSAQGAVAVPPRTLHKYLYTGVRGQPYRIPNTEWSDVAQLPTERFVDMRGIPVPRDRVYNKN